MADVRSALWDSGHDESVEVNQRALIDKVLSRYSGEFTVFRELLQNSDDAQSTSVEIHFQTKAFLARKDDQVAATEDGTGTGNGKALPDLKTAVVHQWTFKNDGIVFREEDWSRLKKIAEGNPDEEKIGAFGVGFYSLFSVTEEPLVTSGEQWMGFHWKDKKDQLFARRGPISSPPSPQTSFHMPLRDPSPPPSPFDLTRFLSSSLTFMQHLHSVSVFFDEHRLTRLTKTRGSERVVGVPRGLVGRSKGGVMNVVGVMETPLNIKAEVMRWVYSAGTEKPLPELKHQKSTMGEGAGAGFFSSLFRLGGSTPQRSPTPLPPPSSTPKEDRDMLSITSTNVTLSIFSADVDVKLDKRMKDELQRSTKKNPPGRLRYEVIYTGRDEYERSREEDERVVVGNGTGSVFRGLRADLNGAGSARIFIGHATAQTTGLGGHMAARFIPTVERESIDLMDRNVAVWNKELLYVGGFLSRAAYEIELANIRQLWDSAKTQPLGAPPTDLQTWLRSRGLHTLKFFTFHNSTPSADVSRLLEDAFFSCGPGGLFHIISTAGVRSASEVRVPNPLFEGFLKQLPVLPEEVSVEAGGMVRALQARGMISQITFADVLEELRSRPLGEMEMIACMRWWIGLNQAGGNPDLVPIRTELLNAAVLTTGTPGGTDERILPLVEMRKFINTRNMGAFIPVDGPIPDDVLPLSVSKNFAPESLSSAFPWTELSIVDWLRHVVNPGPGAVDAEHDLTGSPLWAERVLTVLSRAWPTMSKVMQGDVVDLLKGKTCVPTLYGLKAPEQAYFANVNLFPDLPIVEMPSGLVVKGNLEKVLQALGVRKHVELQIVFDRMIKTGDWTIADLTKYLASVQNTLTTEELARLKMTAAFTKEGGSANLAAGQRAGRYRASELYEPLNVHRELGLPLIDWGVQIKWRASSEEAKFLYSLGLRRSPPLDVIVHLAASEDAAIRPVALKYLLDNMSMRYGDYHPSKFSDVAFVPALKGSVSCMGTPSQVFVSPDWSSIGFLTVPPAMKTDALTKLKLSEHPPTSSLVSLLKTSPPNTVDKGRQVFGVLATRVSAFSPTELKTLSTMAIVPTVATSRSVKGGADTRLLAPIHCYFGGASRAQFHSKLFTFVDFGQPANSFLNACGTKQEPSVDEIASILLDDPRKFYELANGRDNYLDELRNIAVNHRLISASTLGKMKTSPILLGSQRKQASAAKSPHHTSSADFDEDDWDLQYDLKRPDQIVIADDTNGYQLFGDSIFTAPQEDTLEAFYSFLGSRRLSSLIREDYKTNSEVKNSKVATDLRSLILERLPLFLHEHTHSQTTVKYSWLNNESNFIVKTFGKLSVTKSLNYGGARLSRSHDASAAAKRIGSGPIQLWLAGSAQVDMYEVAISLCHLLFQSPKASDALLFMTILSTDLRALKRRGYNVDRILRQQKAERQAAEDAARARAVENNSLMSQSSQDTLVSNGHIVPPNPTTAPPAAGSAVDRDEASVPGPDLKGRSKPASNIVNSIQNFRRKFGSVIDSTHTGQSTLSLNDAINSSSSAIAHKPSSSTVTPLTNISSNIDMAIKACAGEKGDLIRNREHMQMVKESLDEGYCDISGRTGDLSLVGETGGIKVFVSTAVPQPQTILSTKKDVLSAFVRVILPLRGVYKLPLASLHIFYDQTGGMIAFNRNASIFLNLRYFEAWHGEDVIRGDLSKAFISWYFTLAHEIAHNLVQPHNSEHEFYFSALCEAHIYGLGRLLAP